MIRVRGRMTDALDGWTAWTILSALLLVLSTLRFTGFLIRFAGESLQMDFAAFYTAGEALHAGLSPYYTYFEHSPPIWDGINEFTTSRFLYPPLVATFFQPWAILDYATAKVLWMVLGLLCLGGAIFAVKQCLLHQVQPAILLLFGILLTTYYPLLTYLERGQIDALTLLLLTLAILALGSRQQGNAFTAGLLIAVATLFKLQCIYFVPFLLWRRHWWAFGGYTVAGGLLLALSLWVNGSDALVDYAQLQIPRIAQHGDLGAPDTLVDRRTWATLHAGLPDGYTIKDGVAYLPESFFFTQNGTMVRNLHSLWTKLLGPVQQTTVSLAALAGMATLLFGWERLFFPAPQRWSHRRQFYYWQLVLLIILLTGPMTWVMNLIWLLPLALVLLVEATQPQPPQQAATLAIALAALLLTALPDIHTFSLLVPVGTALMRWHYVIGELLLFGALLFYQSPVDSSQWTVDSGQSA